MRGGIGRGCTVGILLLFLYRITDKPVHHPSCSFSFFPSVSVTADLPDPRRQFSLSLVSLVSLLLLTVKPVPPTLPLSFSLPLPFLSLLQRRPPTPSARDPPPSRSLLTLPTVGLLPPLRVFPTLSNKQQQQTHLSSRQTLGPGQPSPAPHSFTLPHQYPPPTPLATGRPLSSPSQHNKRARGPSTPSLPSQSHPLATNAHRLSCISHSPPFSSPYSSLLPLYSLNDTVATTLESSTQLVVCAWASPGVTTTSPSSNVLGSLGMFRDVHLVMKIVLVLLRLLHEVSVRRCFRAG